MAIYRPSKPRWPAAVVGIVAGLLIGVGVGALAFGMREPQPIEGLALVRSTLVDAAGILEVVDVEYDESVNGGQVVSDSEYEGARAALRRSRSRYDDVQNAVSFIDDSGGREIEALYARAQSMMEDREEPQRLAALLERLRARLEDVVDG